jgi:hypothetical protein
MASPDRIPHFDLALHPGELKPGQNNRIGCDKGPRAKIIRDKNNYCVDKIHQHYIGHRIR